MIKLTESYHGKEDSQYPQLHEVYEKNTILNYINYIYHS